MAPLPQSTDFCTQNPASCNTQLQPSTYIFPTAGIIVICIIVFIIIFVLILACVRRNNRNEALRASYYSNPRKGYRGDGFAFGGATGAAAGVGMAMPPPVYVGDGGANAAPEAASAVASSGDGGGGGTGSSTGGAGGAGGTGGSD
ncbi:hypothetical protein MMC06_004815 [Schaereria dolodes]|nr:hypothetical protein [Schaereria dolodes]